MTVPAIPSLGERELEAAFLVAEDRLSVSAVAEKIGVHRATLWEWTKRQEFQLAVEQARGEIQGAIHRRGIANKFLRLHNYQRALERMEQVMEERSRAHGQREPLTDTEGKHIPGDDGLVQLVPRVPGGVSGLLTRDVKMSPTGGYIETFQFDAPFFREYMALHKQMAVEVGDWTEQTKNTNLNLNATTADLDRLTPDQRDAIRRAAVGLPDPVKPDPVVIDSTAIELPPL